MEPDTSCEYYKRRKTHWKAPGGKTLCGLVLAEARRLPVLATVSKYSVTCTKCLGLGRNRLPAVASATATAVSLERIPLYITKLELKAAKFKKAYEDMKDRCWEAESQTYRAISAMEKLGQIVDEWRAHDKTLEERRKAKERAADADIDSGRSSAVA